VTLSALFLAVALATASDAGPRTRLDIPYVPGGGHKQQLDLYLPAGTGFPMVLYVHEGSLTGGDRKDADYPRLAKGFTAAGYGFAVMSYRLFPENRWPAPAEDVASAFAWVKRNAASFGGRPDRVFLVGHSSGATLVARLSSDPRYLAKVGMKPTDITGAVVMGTILRDQEFEEALERATRAGRRARVDSLFQVNPDYSVYGTVENYLDSWPLHHVNAAMPPMLITVAESERLQPPCLAHAIAFRDSANAMGGRVQVALFPDRDHYSAMRKLPEPRDSGFARIQGFFRSIPDPAKRPAAEKK
jgi:acetyl esterase/lipase